MNQLYECFIVGFILLIISVPVMGILQILYPNDYTGCLYLPAKSKTKYYIATLIMGMILQFCISQKFTIIKDVRINHPAIW
jgi:hypothetical protein